MDLDMIKEAATFQLSQIMQNIRDDEDYLLKLSDEIPLYYSNQMLLSKDAEVLRLDVKISKYNFKV